MKELLLEVLGWLGYLERPVVLVQLLICGLLMLSSRVGKRRRWLGRHSALACPALGLTLAGPACSCCISPCRGGCRRRGCTSSRAACCARASC